jgi:hypothetical protein
VLPPKIGKAVLAPCGGDDAIATSEEALRHETAETRGCASDEPCFGHNDFLSIGPHRSNSLFPCRRPQEALRGAPLYVNPLSVPYKCNLALMNDLTIVAVRIEHSCGIIARIVFGPSLRRFLALASGAHRRLVECIYLSMVFRCKSNMDSVGIGLSFFEPEKGSFAVTKTLQIGVSGMAFIVYKVCDPKRLQGLGIKSD